MGIRKVVDSFHNDVWIRINHWTSNGFEGIPHKSHHKTMKLGHFIMINKLVWGKKNKCGNSYFSERNIVTLSNSLRSGVD